MAVDYVIRKAQIQDSEDMGSIHVRAWQAAYRGIMPNDYLDGLRAEDRSAMWRRSFANPPPGQQLRVVLVGEEVAGFAEFGLEESESPGPDVGQLYAINLDPSHWGRGLGRALLREVTQALADSDYRYAVLWVAPENVRARGLYESEGWIDDGSSQNAEVLGVTVQEMRYRRRLAIPGSPSEST